MKRNEDLVSVIVPCYNIELYVERCIKSIQEQTYHNLEIIAIDDGSYDRTAELLEEFTKNDSRMSVYHFEHEGVSCARNHGLDCVTGQNVVYVDGDDFLHIKAIEKLHQIMVENDLDIVASNFYHYYENDRIIGNETDISDYNLSSVDFIQKLLVPSKKFCSPWAKIYKKELFDGVRYPAQVYFGEDMDLAPTLFDRANKVGYTDEALYYYNQQSTSLVRCQYNTGKLHMAVSAKRLYELCQNKYPGLENAAMGYYMDVIINQCTQVAKNKKYYEYYNEYKEILKSEWKYISNADIGRANRIKARLITMFSPQIYNMIHSLLKNRKVQR